MVFRVHAVIDGKPYEPGPIKASEAEKITAWTGYGLKEWEVKLVGESDPLAARALLGLFEFRKGENVRFSALEVDDVDSIDADFKNDAGQVLAFKIGEDAKPVMKAGEPVILLDGEEYDPPPVGATSPKG